MDKSTFYTPSNDINFTRLALAILIGIVVSVGLGYLYNLISTFIPFIYFNVLITIGLGMAIGLCARLISKLCHLSSRKSRLILTSIVIVLTFIFQWVAYLQTVTDGLGLTFGDYLSSIPATLFGGDKLDLLPALYTHGSWGIGDFIFNKLFLAAVWLVELGIIFCIPIFSVLGLTEFPYSENLSKWYPKFTLSDQFQSIASKKYFLEDHKEDVVNAIRALDQGDGRRHGKVHIYFLEGENDQYLSFEKIFIEGSENKKTSSYLIENFRISQADAKSILSEFHNEKEKFVVF